MKGDDDEETGDPFLLDLLLRDPLLGPTVRSRWRHRIFYTRRRKLRLSEALAVHRDEWHNRVLHVFGNDVHAANCVTKKMAKAAKTLDVEGVDASWLQARGRRPLRRRSHTLSTKTCSHKMFKLTKRTMSEPCFLDAIPEEDLRPPLSPIQNSATIVYC